MGNEQKAITIFISYSWDSEEHKEWVKRFADRLIKNGLDVYIDQYDLQKGDRVPHFMEDKITLSDFVLVICTDLYKKKADERTGGVGYEGNIISSELMNSRNERKFIPISRKFNFDEVLPSFMLGKMGICFSEDELDETSFDDLLATLYGVQKKPEIGMKPNFVSSTDYYQYDTDEVKILGIVTNDISIPKMDGTRGSALYKIPFQLSKSPSSLWEDLFLRNWNSPPRFTTIHRPGIATVDGNRIVLNGTTIDEVKKYHRDTLILCVEKSNQEEKTILENERIGEDKKNEHFQSVNAGVKDIKF